jgi:branched-chain amino acid transport system permease protein
VNALEDIVFSGLFVGSLYAMMAVGLALIWTTIGVFNFSHGAFMMLGAYLTWTLTNSDGGLGLPFYLALPLGIAASGAIGWLLQALIVRPFIGRRDIVLLVVIVTLAASSFFENGAQEIWGPRPKQLPPLLEGTAPIFGITASLHQIAIILLSPAILFGVWLLLHRTRLGLMLRAVAQNEEASQLVGLPVKALYGTAFALSAALAGFAGTFLGGFTFMSPSMGADPITKAMIVVIFGGLSSIIGPIIAAYVIGFFEAISTYFLGLYWTPPLLFLLLVVVLMVRPEGLWSRPTRGLA